MSSVFIFLQALLNARGGKGHDPLLEGTTDPVAYEWLRLGTRAAIEGKREDARYFFVQAVRTDIDFARAWLYLGGVADDPALTLSCLNKARQLDPTNRDVHMGIVWAKEGLGLIKPLPAPTEQDEEPRRTEWTPPSRPPALPEPAPPPEPERQSAIVMGLSSTIPAPRIAHQETQTGTPGGWHTQVNYDEPPRPVARQPLPRNPGDTTPLKLSILPTEPFDEPAFATLRPDLPSSEADETASSSAERLIKRGVRAAVAGNRPRARYFFLKAIAAEGSITRAWLYLGAVADDPWIGLACMERVLRAEPYNADAQAGVRWALEKLGHSVPDASW